MGSLALAEAGWELAVRVAAHQSPLGSLPVFRVHDDKGNLLEEKACEENDTKRATNRT